MLRSSGTLLLTSLVPWGAAHAVNDTVSPFMQTERLRVDVETASSLSAGQTVVDIWHQSTQPKNCTVCMVRHDRET